MTETTHIFRISMRPRLYRDIEIESKRSLYDLAGAIVGAFGFEFDHPFGFYGNLTGSVYDASLKYELFADLDLDSDAGSVERTTIAEAFPRVGAKLRFLFDYGDNWQFRVEATRLGLKAARLRYPKLLAAAGRAPEQYPPEK